MNNQNSLEFDIGSLKWVKKIEIESRKQAIESDACLLANYIITWRKYAPEEEQENLEIDIMYESSVGGYCEYDEDEIELIKNKALSILNAKYNNKKIIKYIILKSLIKDNNYTSKNISNLIGYQDDYVKKILENKEELKYVDAVKISKIFHMTPDDLFYSEYIKVLNS